MGDTQHNRALHYGLFGLDQMYRYQRISIPQILDIEGLSYRLKCNTTSLHESSAFVADNKRAKQVFGPG